MTYDVIVVGGSYAGLSAAMQLGRARRRVLLVDSGLPRNRFAVAGHGFFGQDGKPPYQILEEAASQVRVYPTVKLVKGEVFSARKAEEGCFLVSMTGDREERARRLVLATGLCDELPPIPGLGNAGA